MLLTHADLADRRRYLNARHTLRALLDLGVVPIVNENDTVAVEELKFGDNDNLSALTAALVEADLLVILTDVDGLCTRAIRGVDATAPRRAASPRADDAAISAPAGPSRSDVGTGGMASKLAAARKAAAAGIPTVIADGARAHGVLAARLRRRRRGRHAAPRRRRSRSRGASTGSRYTLQARRARCTSTPAPSARSRAEAGASCRRASARVEGRFGVGDCVRCVGPDGARVRARARQLHGRRAARRSRARTPATSSTLLGYKGSDEIIHRDDLRCWRLRAAGELE